MAGLSHRVPFSPSWELPSPPLPRPACWLPDMSADPGNNTSKAVDAIPPVLPAVFAAAVTVLALFFYLLIKPFWVVYSEQPGHIKWQFGKVILTFYDLSMLFLWHWATRSFEGSTKMFPPQQQQQLGPLFDLTAIAAGKKKIRNTSRPTK